MEAVAAFSGRRVGGGDAAGRWFLGLPARLSGSAAGAPAAYEAFETSISVSGDGGPAKLLHLHAHAPGPDGTPPEAAEARKARAYVRLLRGANARLGTRFDAGAMAALVRSLARASGLAACNKFGAEYDPVRRRLLKLTHYFLAEPAERDRLASRVLGGGLRPSPPPFEDDCQAVDWLPDGGVRFKVYQRRPIEELAALGAEGEEVRRAAEATDPFPWVGVVLRYGAQGRRLKGRKIFLRLRRPEPAAGLGRRLAPLGRGDALERALRELGPLRVCYLAWSRGGLELYARAAPAPWEGRDA